MRLSFVVACQEGDTSAIIISNLLDEVSGFAACANKFVCEGCTSDGDVNGDRRLTPEDARCAFRIFLNAQNLPEDCITPNFDCALIAADANCNSITTPADALVIVERFMQNLPPLACFARTGPAKFNRQTQSYQLALSRRAIAPATEKEVVKFSLSVKDPAGLNAFGMTLSYPVDKLDFIGVERTALTANWLQLDGQSNFPGQVTIGGFDDKPLAAGASNTLFHIFFTAKVGQSINSSDLDISQLVDDFSSATIEAAALGEESVVTTPQAFKLYQSFPNPFQTTSTGNGTLIRFDLPGAEAVKVELTIYNITGQVVRRLISGAKSPGAYGMAWDGKDDKGQHAPSGVYLYRLKAGSLVESKRLMMIR